MDFKSFNDLKLVIEMHEQYLEVAKNQFTYYKRLLHKDAPHDMNAINYDAMPHGSGNAMSFDRIYMYMQKYESMIELEEGTLENLNELQTDILDKVKQLDGIDYKVVYMRDIEGMKLNEIAAELNYSPKYIEEVSGRNNRVFTGLHY